MTASVLGIIAGLIGIVLWVLHNRPSAKRAQLLTRKRALEVEYAKALAAKDTVALATLHRRLRELEEDARPVGRL